LPETTNFDCMTEGTVVFTFDAQLFATDPSLWPRIIGAQVTTTVMLRILTPSKRLIVMLTGQPFPA
jgi:hypothetical protein